MLPADAKGSTVIIIIVSVVSGVLLCVMLACLWCAWRRRRAGDAARGIPTHAQLVHTHNATYAFFSSSSGSVHARPCTPIIEEEGEATEPPR